MPQRLANRLLIIGWDGADWQVIMPLLEQGKMPHLKSLVRARRDGKFREHESHDLANALDNDGNGQTASQARHLRIH